MHALVRDHIKERGAEHALPSRPESDGGGDAGAAVETNANGDINQVSTYYRAWLKGGPRLRECCMQGQVQVVSNRGIKVNQT